MARTTSRRGGALDSLIGLFKERGFAGASLSDLAAASGLGRASLYHHFPGGKAEMGRAALAQAGQRFARLVIAPLTQNAPPAQRLLRMIDGIAQFYGEAPLACLTNTMTLGGGADFRQAIAASQHAWLARMADAFAATGLAASEARARAEALAASMHGALVLGRVLEDPALFARQLERMRAEVRAL